MREPVPEMSRQKCKQQRGPLLIAGRRGRSRPRPIGPEGAVDESILVAAARSGDSEAYLRLAGLWQARVRAVAGGLAGPWRGEELARATIAEAWRRLPAMPPSARFGPWLLAILLATQHEAAPAGPAPAPPGPGPDHGARQGGPPLEDAALLGLRAGLADLEAHEREAFLLAGVAGLGYEDVAAVVGRSQSAVADDVYRARVRLARALLADSTGGSR